MFPEALRFKAIREVFSGATWNQKTFMSKKQALYLGYWGKLSRLLIKWQQTGIWGRGKLEVSANAVNNMIQITGARQALSIIELVFRPRPNELY
jgi:hypothetical protein